MDARYFISILLPVKNEGPYIAQCIESFLDQEYPDFEIIIYDNCSTDNTWEVAHEYAAKDSRIKLFRNQREVDPPDNLFLCYEASAGNLIYIMGGDDYIEKSFFVEAVEAFSGNEDMFAFMPRLAYFDDASGRVLDINPPAFFGDYLNRSSVDFTKFYRNHLCNDELVLGIFKREYFDITKHLKRTSSEPVTWWMVLSIFIKAREENKVCLFLEEPLIRKRCGCTYELKSSFREDIRNPVALYKRWMSFLNIIFVFRLAARYSIFNASRIAFLLLVSSLRRIASNALSVLRGVQTKARALSGKCGNLFRLLYRRFYVDGKTKRFIEHNRKVWGDWSVRKSEGVILVDLYGVNETLISFSYFANILARKHGAAINSFGPRKRMPNPVLHHIYTSFNTSGHIVPSLNEEQEQRRKAISDEVLPILKTKQDVFDLHVQGIWVGIDIYETYLRGGKPTVCLDDPQLIKTVEEGIGLVIFWQDYFAAHKVAALIVSHDVYLHMNVPCKVAYQAGVPAYLPNARGIWYVDKPFSGYLYLEKYHEMFNRLPVDEQKRGMEIAKKQLEKRFSGEVGVDMAYSTKSAFSPHEGDQRVLRQSDRIKVLICTHCFFDNPQAYSVMPFVDFYEWIKYLGEMSRRTDYDWYLKVHPDFLPGTLESVGEILKDYPLIKVIPHDTSHHQLVEEGIDFVLTAFGSVGHEYPAWGVQVINAAYNPHVAYSFDWHAKSLEEYEHYLMNLDKLKKDVDLDEIYEFYYMHYYYVPADDLIFQSHRKYLKDLTPEQREGSEVYEYFLDQLTDEKHDEIIHNMRNFIDSGKHYYFSQGPYDILDAD